MSPKLLSGIGKLSVGSKRILRHNNTHNLTKCCKTYLGHQTCVFGDFDPRCDSNIKTK